MYKAELTEDIKHHTLMCFPYEACGVVTTQGFIPVQNTASDPKSSFQIKYEVFNDIAKNNEVVAIFHSHCREPDKDYGFLNKFDPRTPSPKDVATQKALGIPFWITATDGETVEPLLVYPEAFDRPLLGRKFIWYINDCWTLVRDYYIQKYGINLGWHSNTFDWYNNGKGVTEPYYKQYFQERGFRQIDECELRDGDLIVMGVQGEYNHIGIFEEKEYRILQQLVERPSGKYPMSSMRSYIQMYLRYNNEKV